MNSNDIFLSILIIFLFCLLFVSSMLESRRKVVQENWDKMKCNPTVMPFASSYGPINGKEINSLQNFSECMQSMQQTAVFDFFGPIYKMFESVSEFTASIQNEINSVRLYLSTLVDMINDTFSIFFIVIANVTSGMYKILGNMKDTTERLVSVNHILKGMLDQSHGYITAISNIGEVTYEIEDNNHTHNKETGAKATGGGTNHTHSRDKYRGNVVGPAGERSKVYKWHRHKKDGNEKFTGIME